MNYDISDLLKEWQFNPNEFTARRIKSKDGKEKIQIRMDLGIMQLELDGRPDGKHPHDHPSLLHYYETINEDISLDEEECEGLFQEAWQYYHRYLSLFYLEDYAGVVRDTEHVLGILSTVQKYAHSEEVKWYFDQYYPHSIMMQTRAKATLALVKDDYQAALREIQAGIGHLEQYLEEWEGEGLEEDLPELSFLREWHEEVEQKRPLSKREQLERDLNVAVATENFEEAARLRDKIQRMWPGPRRLFRPER